MTPVEERIDFEEAKRIAEAWLEPGFDGLLSSDDSILARAYLALLTEHSAREDVLLAEAVVNGEWQAARELAEEIVKAHDALPATESAQPEERGVDLTLRCPTCGRRADMCFEHGDDWKKRPDPTQGWRFTPPGFTRPGAQPEEERRG